MHLFPLKNASRVHLSKTARQLRMTPRLVTAVALTLAGNAAHGAIDTWAGNTSVNWNAANWTGGNPIPLDFDARTAGMMRSAITLMVFLRTVLSGLVSA
jgi:hypothetical protein